MAKALVSILIVNWNGGEVFKECLHSLSKISYPNWEVIVVDNASIDKSEKYVKKILPKATLIIEKKNLGFAGGNNSAYKHAQGEYILLLNNDTKVPPDFLNKLVSQLEKDPKIAAIQPKIYLMDEDKLLDNCGSFLTRIGFLQHWGFFKKDAQEFNTEKFVFSAKGACMLIRKSVIEKVGLFDNDFGSYFEETDFCWKAWLVGYKVLYFPKTYIFHKLAYTAKRMNPFSVNYHSYKNRICSLLKNLNTLNVFIFLTSHLLVLEGLSFYYLLHWKLHEILIIHQAIFWNIKNLPTTLKKRKVIQKLRIKTDSEIFKFSLQPINIGSYLYSLGRLNKDMEN